jgi:hypothetical protein
MNRIVLSPVGWLFAIRYSLLAGGCWLLAAGCWLLAAGRAAVKPE